MHALIIIVIITLIVKLAADISGTVAVKTAVLVKMPASTVMPLYMQLLLENSNLPS